MNFDPAHSQYVRRAFMLSLANRVDKMSNKNVGQTSDPTLAHCPLSELSDYALTGKSYERANTHTHIHIHNKNHTD